MKRELDRKGRELIKERSDRQKLADSVKRDECRINGVCYAYHDTGGHVKANQVLDKQFLSKNQAMPRGSRLSPLSFTKVGDSQQEYIRFCQIFFLFISGVSDGREIHCCHTKSKLNNH